MSLINEPSPLAFADNLPLPTPENIMNPVQRYWYNRGHEDGRKLVAVKEITDEINSPHNACCYRDKCRQQQTEIEVLNEMLACEGIEASREYLDYRISELRKVKENE